jgi:hypothetical protein
MAGTVAPSNSGDRIWRVSFYPEHDPAASRQPTRDVLRHLVEVAVNLPRLQQGAER